VDAYFSELKGRNVDVSGAGDRSYGMRYFEVVDPDGNRLAFGEPTIGSRGDARGALTKRAPRGTMIVRHHP
jgi:hypothetical protein